MVIVTVLSFALRLFLNGERGDGLIYGYNESSFDVFFLLGCTISPSRKYGEFPICDC